MEPIVEATRAAVDGICGPRARVETPAPAVIEQPQPEMAASAARAGTKSRHPGRVVPPTLRLRIEEQRPTTPTAPLSEQHRCRGSSRGRFGEPSGRRRPSGGAPPSHEPTPVAARPSAQPTTRPASSPPPRPSTYPDRDPSVSATWRSAARCRLNRFALSNPEPSGRVSFHSVPALQCVRRCGRRHPVHGRRRQRREVVRPMLRKCRQQPPPVSRTITSAEGMTVKDLADKLGMRANDVLGKLLMKGLMLRINSTLDAETATMRRSRVRSRRSDCAASKKSCSTKTPAKRIRKTSCHEPRS